MWDKCLFRRYPGAGLSFEWFYWKLDSLSLLLLWSVLSFTFRKSFSKSSRLCTESFTKLVFFSIPCKVALLPASPFAENRFCHSGDRKIVQPDSIVLCFERYSRSACSTHFCTVGFLRYLASSWNVINDEDNSPEFGAVVLILYWLQSSPATLSTLQVIQHYF